MGQTVQFNWKKNFSLLFCVCAFLSSVPGFTAPQVECVKQAQAFGYESEVALRLCQGAQSADPVACYREAILLTRLSQEQAIELCRVRLNVCACDRS
ncbi:MAG: hypothetical protein ACO3A2_03285 [Bdellovibrionia bacterium]